MQRFLHTAIIALLFLSLFIMAQPLLAQDSVVTDDEVNEVAKDVYCPVCESTPLDVCATQACADWRELIRTKLGEGQSKEEIFDYFGRQYGDGVLGKSAATGRKLNHSLGITSGSTAAGGVFLQSHHAQNAYST